MQQLGVAINKSLTDSESLSEAMAEIREAGYDIFLILEATIGFNKRTEKQSTEGAATSVVSGDLVLNAQDAKFLKSLRITLSGNSDSIPKQDQGN
ncbi:MAG: hypothetical protein HY316_04045 [Acidobacteria bacterium]|nr:hypothetical protein [Acidobacteriota bacterium]